VGDASVIPLEIRVLYGDVDQMGFVYYANYLRYFEAGRGEFLRAHGRSYRDVESQGLRLPVIEARLSYRAPARYDDLLRLETELTHAGGATFRFVYSVRRDEAELVTGETVHACLNARGKPTRVPSEIVAMATEGS
jgi:acyl-CoA thioester hydrolase